MGVGTCGNPSGCAPAGEGGDLLCVETVRGVSRCLGGLGCIPTGDGGCEENLDCCEANCVDGSCEPFECLADGESCNFSDQCCSGICAPDENGELVSSPECIPLDGACTTDTDCCGNYCDTQTMTCATSYDRTRVATLLKRAATNIVSGRNDCGRLDRIGATHGFDGSASEEPGVSIVDDQVVCRSDGRTVVGFKALGSGFKAATCWWWDGDDYLIESDIAMSRLTSWVFSDTIPSSCTSALHFESVATHEFGHAFGLNHPGSSHSALTMQPGAACDASKATLGLGDLVGLEAIY